MTSERPSWVASPRRRRRLIWLAAVLGVVGAVALIVVLLPSYNGAPTTPSTPPAAPTFGASTSPNETPFGPPPSEATRRAQVKAEHEVRPLAARFVRDIVAAQNLSDAFSLLDARLREKNSLSAWRGGHLPLKVSSTAGVAGEDIAYSGSAMVGLVLTINPNDADLQAGSILYALRFVRVGSEWRIDYVHQGQSSQYVDGANYSPHGFLPGSSPASTSSWLILILGFVGLVAVVAMLDHFLAQPRRSQRARPDW